MCSSGSIDRSRFLPWSREETAGVAPHSAQKHIDNSKTIVTVFIAQVRCGSQLLETWSLTFGRPSESRSAYTLYRLPNTVKLSFDSLSMLIYNLACFLRVTRWNRLTENCVSRIFFSIIYCCLSRANRRLSPNANPLAWLTSNYTTKCRRSGWGDCEPWQLYPTLSHHFEFSQRKILAICCLFLHE